jgi:LmbE family N-acetylglucosaminyl deacetylase
VPVASPVVEDCCGEAQAEGSAAAAVADEAAGKLRIICFGAHPDDCELRAAGTGALWARQGHKVKFVSVTNGDIGHWQMAGGPLAQRRKAEVERSARILGIEAQVLDIHDGELLPTLEHRRTITRLIREWNADVVMCHRPNDYHPDHRNVGLLVQDAAFMVTVPFFCPDTPCLDRNPVFLYYEDRFQKPNPFAGDVVVAIDETLQQKMAMVEALESQFFEGGCCGGMKEIPRGAEADARKKVVHESFQRRFAATADRFRDRLLHYYGPQQGAAVGYAEAFEICEYGRRPSPAEIRQLFPFFPAEQ